MAACALPSLHIMFRARPISSTIRWASLRRSAVSLFLLLMLGAQPVRGSVTPDAAGPASVSHRLLVGMPPAVTLMAGTDDVSALLHRVRMLPQFTFVHRAGLLQQTEHAWGKLADVLAAEGASFAGSPRNAKSTAAQSAANRIAAERLLLTGPLAFGTLSNTDDGFIVILALSRVAANKLRAGVEAVPTEVVDGVPILSIDRGGLQLALIETGSWLTLPAGTPKRTAVSWPFVGVVAPPHGKGPALMRESVRLLQARDAAAGPVKRNTPPSSASGYPLVAEHAGRLPSAVGWAIRRGGVPGGSELARGWVAHVSANEREVSVAVMFDGVRDVPQHAGITPTNAQWPSLPDGDEVALAMQQADGLWLSSMPHPLTALRLGAPLPQRGYAELTLLAHDDAGAPRSVVLGWREPRTDFDAAMGTLLCAPALAELQVEPVQRLLGAVRAVEGAERHMQLPGTPQAALHALLGPTVVLRWPAPVTSQPVQDRSEPAVTRAWLSGRAGWKFSSEQAGQKRLNGLPSAGAVLLCRGFVRPGSFTSAAGPLARVLPQLLRGITPPGENGAGLDQQARLPFVDGAAAELLRPLSSIRWTLARIPASDGEHGKGAADRSTRAELLVHFELPQN